jgi:hypothetical protein
MQCTKVCSFDLKSETLQGYIHCLILIIWLRLFFFNRPVNILILLIPVLHIAYLYRNFPI